MNVIIDTREKELWSFPEYVNCIRGTLPTADYALAGDSDFAIERKEKNDFLGSISSNWERFKRELSRMDGWPAKVIIVECDFEHFCFTQSNNAIKDPDHNHFKLKPQFIASRIAELTMMRVSVLFAGNAGYASALAYHILKERERQIKKEVEDENKCDNK